jgi:hypothetical protein
MPSKENESSFLDIVKLHFSAFADKAHKAAVGGALALTENLRESADELLPENSIVIDKVKTALQSGAAVAGEQLMAAGTEFLQAIKNARQNKTE